MTKMFPIGLKGNKSPDYYILIEWPYGPNAFPHYPSEVPEMIAFKVDTTAPSIEDISIEEFREHYKYVIGENNQIEFWHILETIRNY